ncbi:hypothetical protein U0070_019335 [Myodes glareolus]|uniref:Large ribosomal subunit protein eL36 n=1 Tax=Myodes glareolus TaxID=447135 RepID=A0AAW0H0X7_MYOGA
MTYCCQQPWFCATLWLWTFHEQARHSGCWRHLTKHTKFMWEVCGFAPYQQGALELLSGAKDKQVPEFLKKRTDEHTATPKEREGEELSKSPRHHEEGDCQDIKSHLPLTCTVLSVLSKFLNPSD